MSLYVSFHEAAEGELNEAADFYDLASPELGSLFIGEIQRTIDRIKEFPESILLIGDGSKSRSQVSVFSILPIVRMK